LATHKREIESLYLGVDVHIRQFDAGDEASVKAVVDDAIEKYGRLDVMFANAGIVGQPKIFTEITANQFMGTLKTNTIGYVQSLAIPTLIYNFFPSMSIGLASNA
jgi:Dehydrogenases with different specificities (related to short-chain alcohol dehydrogenases)